jgi:hypothetical protein
VDDHLAGTITFSTKCGPLLVSSWHPNTPGQCVLSPHDLRSHTPPREQKHPDRIDPSVSWPPTVNRAPRLSQMLCPLSSSSYSHWPLSGLPHARGGAGMDRLGSLRRARRRNDSTFSSRT